MYNVKPKVGNEKTIVYFYETPTPPLSRAQDGNEAESGAETSLLPSAQAIKTKKTDPLDSVANLRSQRTKIS
jgi:hypothetical protein